MKFLAALSRSELENVAEHRNRRIIELLEERIKLRRALAELRKRVNG